MLDTTADRETRREFQWTPEAVSRFWGYCASRLDADKDYFANQFGGGVTEFLSHAVQLRGASVLDYGCGPGYLVPHLLARGCNVSAVDFSSEAVARVNQAFAGHAGWQGGKLVDRLPLPWGDNSFDVICCLETIEHVLDEHLDPMFAELRRLLNRGGRIIFTTPHDEAMHRRMVECPACHTHFHMWQHVRKWTAASLRQTLERHGYTVRFCRGVDFSAFQQPPRQWKDISPRSIVGSCKAVVRSVMDAVAPRPFPAGRRFSAIIDSHARPHLVAVASRS